MSEKRILTEIRDLHIAVELICLDARMSVLESETSLSRRKLLQLYKALKDSSPVKGMLPFSPDWFMMWEHNIHASLFYNIYLYLHKTEQSRPIEALLKAYRLYHEQCSTGPDEKPVLGITRAWTLLRFISCGMISQKMCCGCGGSFIVPKEYMKEQFTCCLCCPPSRALKKNKICDSSVESLLSTSDGKIAI